MRLVWLTGVGACLAVQGCTPLPSQYYGAPPGYAPQPYGPTSGVAEPQPPLDDAGYAQPGYVPPAELPPGPSDYGYAAPPPAYGYAAAPVLPPVGFFGSFGGRERFDRSRFDRDRFDRDRFGRSRENAERERFERERFEQRLRERDRPRPPPGQPFPASARPPEARQPGGHPGHPPERRGDFEHMRERH